MNRPIVAVIGGGVAGAHGAEAASEFGLDVLLFDRFNPASLPTTASSATVLDNTPVWGLFPGWTVAAAHLGDPVVEQVDAVLIATGAIDRAIPFAGSTLPGVITASALIRLIEIHRLLPGQRFLVVGDGPQARDVIALIEQAGGELSLQVTEDDARSMIAHGQRGIASIAVHGITTGVDIAVMAAGNSPDVLLAAMAGCELRFDPGSGSWAVRRDADLQTTVPDIWAAGDVAGITDVGTASAEGRFAAAGMAFSVEAIDERQLDRERNRHAAASTRPKGEAAASLNSIRQPWMPGLALSAQKVE